MSATHAQDLQYSDELFLAVPTASLIHRKTSVSDLFIRLETGRMIKVAHKGAGINTDQVQRLNEKDVKYLYVFKSDLSNIVSDLIKGAEGLNQLKNVPSDLRIAKFFSIAESVYAELLQLPITDEALGRAVRLTQEISNSMRESPDYRTLVGTIIGLGDDFARHSLGTVVAANLVMTQLKWRSPKVVGPVTTAAFFHDIGLKELPEELRHKPTLEMNREETILWETHPALGVRIMSSMNNSITPDVLRMVQEHHEVGTGAGFPNRLRLERIFPLARLISMSNMLAHDLFKTNGNNATFSAEQMAQKIEHVYALMFGQDLARAALRIFKKEDE